VYHDPSAKHSTGARKWESVLNKVVLTLLIIGTAIIASAQPSAIEATISKQLEGTVYTIARRSSADGVLEACGLEFSEIKRDFSTKRGAPVTMVGSFYLRLTQKAGLVYNMKLGIFDGLSNTTRPIAPANAFISAPRGKAPKKAIRRDSDTTGYALFVGAVDDDVLAAYSEILETKKLVVGFNRAVGQQDVSATIDLTVVDADIVNNEMIRTRSDDAVNDFSSCVGDLVKMVK
jgi:hypothetical protein